MSTHILDTHAEPDIGRRLETAEEVARNAGLLSVADTIREVASPQRRALLLGTAALAGGAAANAAAIVTSRAAEGGDASPDPIFAAIEHHRITRRDYLNAVRVMTKLESELEGEFASAGVANPISAAGEDPRYIAAEEAAASAMDDTDAAAIALVETAPATLAGVAALMRHVRETEAPRDLAPWPQAPKEIAWSMRLHRQVADALNALVAQGGMA